MHIKRKITYHLLHILSLADRLETRKLSKRIEDTKQIKEKLPSSTKLIRRTKYIDLLKHRGFVTGTIFSFILVNPIINTPCTHMKLMSMWCWQ